MKFGLESPGKSKDTGAFASDLNLPYYEQFLSEAELALMRYDSEGLRMSMPISVCERVVRRIPGDEVLDLCCGVGSFAVALALAGKRVIAVDNSQDRLSIAQGNACRFHVEHMIDFRLQDCRSLGAVPKVSAVFFDPPWGGSARRVSEFALSNFEIDVSSILKSLVDNHRYVAMKLPFNFIFSELEEISSKWRFTPIEHDKLHLETYSQSRPLFWLAEHQD